LDFSFFERSQKEGFPTSNLVPQILPAIVWNPQDLRSVGSVLELDVVYERMDISTSVTVVPVQEIK
jgi:hypothetical protein